jgi:hypothetical protein
MWQKPGTNGIITVATMAEIVATAKENTPVMTLPVKTTTQTVGIMRYEENV